MLDFLRRGSVKTGPEPARAGQAPTVVDHAASRSFRAKSGDRVRLSGRPDPAEVLPILLEGIAHEAVEVVPPRAAEFSDAAPTLEQPEVARQWLRAHEANGPVARHTILVLESTGAADLAVEGLACALLHGDRDASGYPEEDAIVGGYASRWDEKSGDLIVRPVVAWGGSGLRGDTERHAQQLIGLLHARLLERAEGEAPATEPQGDAAAERDRCPHCGFEVASPHAMFCPKCGMRIRQG